MTRIKVPLEVDGPEAREEPPAGAVVLTLPDVGGPARSSEADLVAVAAAAKLRPVGGFRHNLPVQLTSFIGRDAEKTQVRDLLAGW